MPQTRRGKLKPLARVLRENTDQVVSRSVALIRQSTRTPGGPAIDHETANYLGQIVAEDIAQLESARADETTEASMVAAAVHGRAWRSHGYPIAALIEESRILSDTVFDVVEENL